MMYLKIENFNKTITFAPINDSRVYVDCETCGKMAPLIEVADVWECFFTGSSFEDVSECNDCFEERMRKEDLAAEILAKQKEESAEQEGNHSGLSEGLGSGLDNAY